MGRRVLLALALAAGLLAVLALLGLQADEAVMLGDTPYDVRAAQRAGVAVIAVRCGGWPDHDLHGALANYDDPADLLAHYDDSPLVGAPDPRG